MRNNTQELVMMEGLESRTLLSAAHPLLAGFRHHLPDPADQSPEVQADLLKIQDDKQQLAADRSALADMLAADRQAIRDAIKALDSQLAPLKQTLKDDTKTWWTTLRNDLKALFQARNDPAARQAALDQLKADRADAQAALKADADAIKAVIDNDPDVQAARQKLETDQQPIKDDLAALDADFKQLKLDLKAERSAGGTANT